MVPTILPNHVKSEDNISFIKRTPNMMTSERKKLSTSYEYCAFPTKKNT